MFVYIFVGGFTVFLGQKTNHFFYYCPNLVSEPLVCYLKSCEFSPKFHHFFSIPSFWRVAPKITVLCLFVIFHCPFSWVWSLIWVIYLFIVYLPEKELFIYLKEEQPIIAGCLSGPPILAIKGTPANHDTQTYCLGPMWNYVSICHLSWVVYGGNNRPCRCLLSACMTQIWPRTLMIRGLLQRVTKENSFLLSFFPAFFLPFFFPSIFPFVSTPYFSAITDVHSLIFNLVKVELSTFVDFQAQQKTSCLWYLSFIWFIHFKVGYTPSLRSRDMGCQSSIAKLKSDVQNMIETETPLRQGGTISNARFNIDHTWSSELSSSLIGCPFHMALCHI